MQKKDLFSKYKSWNQSDDGDDYLKFGSISEEEQPVMPKNKKHTTSKKPITPKKTKADVKLDQAELQKLSSEEDFEVDEDLYKDPVLQFNDVSLPEITPPKTRSSRRKVASKDVLPTSSKNVKKSTKKKPSTKTTGANLSTVVRPKTPENIIAIVDLCGPATPPCLVPIFQKNVVQVVGNEDEDLNDSFDYDVYKIKVKWQGKVEIFPMRKHQKFQYLMEKLAARVNAETSSIFLNEGDRIIGRDETPDSIGYRISMFISARVLQQSFYENTLKQKQKANEMELRIQSAKWKKPRSFKMIKTDTFKTLFEKIAEECGCSENILKLSFDGDNIKRSDKPLDHEMEGGEVLDCNI